MIDPHQRIAEIAEILAAGLIRRIVRMSSQISTQLGESSLDISADKSGHPTPSQLRTSDG